MHATIIEFLVCTGTFLQWFVAVNYSTYQNVASDLVSLYGIPVIVKMQTLLNVLLNLPGSTSSNLH